MKVLITGGAGFIGSHLALAWARRGANVVVLDSLRTGNRENLTEVPCEFVQGSVEDAELVARCCKGADYVHHLAALVSVPESVANPHLTEAINVGGTLNVLEGARSAGSKKVVLASTCAVYGEVERGSHSESDLPAPVSPYAISKLSGEMYFHYYAHVHKQPTAVMRFFNVYGPRQDPKSAYAAAVAIFSSRARSNEPIRIYDDGEQTRDFVYVEDIVEAQIAAAEMGSGTYNVANGKSTTINDLARMIIEASHSTSTIEHLPARAGDIRHSSGNADRLKALGWAPRIDLKSGIIRTLQSF